MSTRSQNEGKFSHWADLPGGGRRYWIDVEGRQGWRAEVHHKFPVDEGHRKA